MAVKTLVGIGKPAVPALINVLRDPRNEVRALAAEAMRSILADPANAPNYHEKTYWAQRLAQLRPRMKLDEALAVLLPELSPPERRKTCVSGSWSGDSGFFTCRLDDYWAVQLYVVGHGHEHLPDQADANLCRLDQSVRKVWVAPPAGYTGVWVTWHTNGQKANKIQYRNGKPDGLWTAFYDDDSKCYEQHFVNGVCQGSDTGWTRSGKKLYQGQYEHGKPVGAWWHWKENGQVESIPMPP